MVISTLRLQQFRSYSDATFAFSPGVNVIVGQNGRGKTNLLEAVYLLATGSSFRVADKELVQYDKDWFRLDAEFDDHKRSLRYQQAQSPAKHIVINDGEKKRFTRQFRLPVVLFEPDMLRVLSGSPARRRVFLDGLISQWFDDGAALIRRYERVLLQRNAVLKQAFELPSSVVDDRLFAWDMSLAELIARLEMYRYKVVAVLDEAISDQYSQIAQKTQHVKVAYQSSLPDGADQPAIIEKLRAARRLDTARGYTTLGPHRSDFSVLLNGQPIETTASRGEQRSIVLAMKNIEAQQLITIYDTTPLLLFDDVMSELDHGRQRSIQQNLQKGQIIITSTDAEVAKISKKIIL